MPSSATQKPPVLVTGSSGLIGSRLCEALAVDYNVLGLDVKKPDSMPPDAEWIECDLTTDAGARAALDAAANLVGKDIASVVHLAAYYDFSGCCSCSSPSCRTRPRNPPRPGKRSTMPTDTAATPCH